MSKQSAQKNLRLSPDLLKSLADLADEHEETNVTQFIVKCVRMVSSLNKLSGMEKKKSEGYTTLETIKRATLEFVDE